MIEMPHQFFYMSNRKVGPVWVLDSSAPFNVKTKLKVLFINCCSSASFILLVPEEIMNEL